jgi:hypothetical protein
MARTFKIFPNWDFWFENNPSGNPYLRILCLSSRTLLEAEHATTQNIKMPF